MTFTIPSNPSYIQESPIKDFISRKDSISKKLGTKILDLPIGAESPMKKANDAVISTLKKQYESDVTTYEKKFKAAEINATEAKSIINNETKKRNYSLIAFAVCTIAFVALSITIALAPPAALCACIIGTVIVGTGMAAGIMSAAGFSDRIAHFKGIVNAPGLLAKPIMPSLPYYDATKDLDLHSTRLDVQKSFTWMSLKQIKKSGISEDEIIGYELLEFDGSHHAPELYAQDKPAFYTSILESLKLARNVN